MLEQLIIGFQTALTFSNLLFIFCGIALGIIFGVLPGLGSVTAIAILIPVTFYMSPMSAIGFLVGVNKGGTSGGAIPAILINAPGTPESTATTRDGYPLTQKGMPEKAMKMALYSSATGDMFSDAVLILLAAPFAKVALMFGPAEITSIIVFAFTLIAALSGNSLIKGITAAAFGVFLSTIGLDPVTSGQRMSFDVIDLYDGISLNSLAIGTLALSSVLSQLFDLRRKSKASSEPVQFADLDREKQRLSFGEYFGCFKTILRSAFIGSGVGMLPGLGVTLAAFLGYGAAKRASKNPEKFGTGILEGIAATEAANSAVVGSNLIPTIALGIPGNIVAALLIGAFMIHGVTPGPMMMQAHGHLIYGIFASMLMANVAHVIVGRIGIRIWGQITRVPQAIVLPIVIPLCIAGVYIPSHSLFEIGLMFAFAALAYVMRKTGFSLVSLLIGFLLGPMLEFSLRQALILYKGDWSVFFSKPIALVFFVLTVVFLWRFAWKPAKLGGG
jgi:putative tricarboxylic transport membrane protein